MTECQIDELNPGRLRKDAALYDLPPACTGRRGRPRAKGARLPPLDLLARRAAIACLWYGGTPPRRSRRPRTCSPSSAASSSPLNFGHLALTSQP